MANDIVTMIAMKLNKLVAAEVTIIVLVVALSLAFVRVNPYLQPEKEELPSGWISPKRYNSRNMTIKMGETLKEEFAYPGYEPTVSTINIYFVSCEKEGVLKVQFNDISVANVTVTKQIIERIQVASCCGINVVRPEALNEVTFSSPSDIGYEGTFWFFVDIRY